MTADNLIGAELDAAVAVAAGFVLPLVIRGILTDSSLGANDWRPSADWSQGGPIIERELIELVIDSGRDGEVCWTAGLYRHGTKFDRDGPTALVAAMRAFVASKA